LRLGEEPIAEDHHGVTVHGDLTVAAATESFEADDQVVPSDAVLMRPTLTVPRAVIAVLDHETATNELH
jgi:hypothetical protein